MKLHTGDTVVVITGKDKGKTGTILRVMADDHRVVIGGINMRTRHIKKTFQEAGKTIQFEASIHASNVMLVDPKSKKRSRVGYMLKDGKMLRISKESGSEVTKVKAVKAVKKAKTETKAPTEGKKTAKTKQEEAAVSETKVAKKQPFWKRMKFGEQAMEDAEVTEGSRMKQDHSIPDQQISHKSAGRGS